MPSQARVAKQTKGRQEDLVVAFFARALTENFDSKIANGGPLFFGNSADTAALTRVTWSAR